MTIEEESEAYGQRIKRDVDKAIERGKITYPFLDPKYGLGLTLPDLISMAHTRTGPTKNLDISQIMTSAALIMKAEDDMLYHLVQARTFHHPGPLEEYKEKGNEWYEIRMRNYQLLLGSTEDQTRATVKALDSDLLDMATKFAQDHYLPKPVQPSPSRPFLIRRPKNPEDEGKIR